MTAPGTPADPGVEGTVARPGGVSYLRIPARDVAQSAEFYRAVFAEVLIQSAQRAAGLTLAALEAARIDEDIAAVAAQLMTQRQVMATWLVDGLLRRSPLRDGADRAAAIDTVWALMDPAVFCRLTGDRGWGAARFGDWFADSSLRLLLPVRDRQATAADHCAWPGWPGEAV